MTRLQAPSNRDERWPARYRPHERQRPDRFDHQEDSGMILAGMRLMRGAGVVALAR